MTNQATASPPAEPVDPRLVAQRRREQTVARAVYYARSDNRPRFVVRAGGSDFTIEWEPEQNQDITDVVWPSGRVYSVTELIQRYWQSAGR